MMEKLLKIKRLLALFTVLLLTTLVHAQIEVGEYTNTKYSLTKTYSPPPLQIGRSQLVKKLNKNIKEVKTMSGNMGAWKGLTALEDRFIMQAGTMFFYSDIVADEKIKVYKNNPYDDWGVSVPVSQICGKPDDGVSFHFTSQEYALEFAENIFYIQQPFRKEQLKIKQLNDSLIRADSIRFSILVAKYRKMEIKPVLTEEQRKYIIQANSFTNDKLYEQAIEVYKKALAIDPVAYPAAYYNMALLLAEKNDFEEAIINMKKYLLLVPGASDARAAQDKIYEWER